MSEPQPPPSGGPPPPSGAEPPPGPPPLYYGDPATLPHDSLRPNIIAAGVICWVLAAIFVAMRFYARAVLIRVLSWTDWCILLALVFSAGDLVALIDQVIHGSGAHIWDLDPTAFNDAMAWSRAGWYGIVMYLLCLLFTKLSILFLYIHIFAFKWARLAGQILMSIVITTGLFMLITTLTACVPLEAYWNFFIPRNDPTRPVYCHAQGFWWANTGMHMVTDLLIFLLPMPVVWSITLPRRQKAMLFGVFGLGFVVCFISILRLLKLDQNIKNMDPSAGPYDFTYFAAELSYLTSVELNAGIVCACCMTLKPLLAKVAPRWLGSLRAESGSSSGSPGRGPPTIGSEPTRAPLNTIDGELMGQVGGREPGLGNTWTVAAGGYFVIEERKGVWVDVEIGGRRKEVTDERLREELSTDGSSRRKGD